MGLKELQAVTAARTGIKPGETKQAKTDTKGPKSETKKRETVKKSQKNAKSSKRIKPRSKKMAKKMRELGKINKELLGDKTGDPQELCEIQSPVCTRIATVLNHNQGREGDNLLDKSKLTKCCPPCNDYIEAHHEWARERGFKAPRHGKK